MYVYITLYLYSSYLELCSLIPQSTTQFLSFSVFPGINTGYTQFTAPHYPGHNYVYFDHASETALMTDPLSPKPTFKVTHWLPKTELQFTNEENIGPRLL